MSLFDFFFPEQAQASHLRRLAESQSRQGVATGDLHQRIDNLENDLGFIALVLGSILERLDRNGAVTRDEVREAINELDMIDGIPNGKLDINFLRGQHR